MKILQVISDNAQASKRKNKKDFIENLFDNCAATTDSAVDSLDVRCLPLGELSQKVLKVGWKKTFYQNSFEKFASALCVLDNKLSVTWIIGILHRKKRAVLDLPGDLLCGLGAREVPQGFDGAAE